MPPSPPKKAKEEDASKKPTKADTKIKTLSGDVAELSEEDQALQKEMELLVERVRDPVKELRKAALEKMEKKKKEAAEAAKAAAKGGGSSADAAVDVSAEGVAALKVDEAPAAAAPAAESAPAAEPAAAAAAPAAEAPAAEVS